MSPHFRSIVAGFVACAAVFFARAAIANDAVFAPTFAEPSVSPDHSEIAFLSGGDVWSVSSRGGIARLLADTGGTAERPLFSPDGTRIAFVLTKAGSAGIEVLDLAAGRLSRVTYNERSPTLDAWSADGHYLFFSSSEATIGSQSAIRRVPAEGGSPVDVRSEPYVNQMEGKAGSTLIAGRRHQVGSALIPEKRDHRTLRVGLHIRPPNIQFLPTMGSSEFSIGLKRMTH